MIEWPKAFPKPEIGFAVEVTSSTDRLKMDSGQHRQRPVRRGKMYLVNASFVLVGLRLAMFNAWFKHHVKDGKEGIRFPELPVFGNLTFQEGFFTSSGYKVTLKEPPFVWTVQTEFEMFFHAGEIGYLNFLPELEDFVETDLPKYISNE